jgi:cyanophycinase-like exopeptidase
MKEIIMNRMIIVLLFFFPFLHPGIKANYSAYRIGNTKDTITQATGGICLMGGATEDDNAMKWFLQRASGGDIVVLRTSGSDGYNTYLYSDLGIPVNSVETIVCNNAAASYEPYIVQKIQKAEAIWFAGGDQWTYITYWRNTPIDSAINDAISRRNIVIGGISAGMAIQGKYYFTAQNGTVNSANCLANPYNTKVTIDSALFLKNAVLNNTITDTHFDNPDRKGRLITFLARIYADYGIVAKAIACDENTAVCIDNNGIARIFGGYPAYDDNAYFIQSNCGISNNLPEQCIAEKPLTWDRQKSAIKVYKIKGDKTGSAIFDLKNWQKGNGGEWHNWSVSDGSFLEKKSDSINCNPLSVNDIKSEIKMIVFPNPVHDKLNISINTCTISLDHISIYDMLGNHIPQKFLITDNTIIADITGLYNALYFLRINGKNGQIYHTIFIKN